jgi:4-amino-4-deoxy-L-arabinose transferase-like glycosyltransferase
VTRLLPFALAALLALTLLPGIAAVDALDVREARDLITARESTAGREWLTPLYANEPFFEKPLPGYAPDVFARMVWARAASAAGAAADAGTDVAVSRAVRALLAAALALAVALMGTRTFGARSGWLAACALASMVGLPLAARADGAQVLASLLAWLGIAAWLGVLTGRSRRPGLAVALGWLGFGGAALAGGPLPALWPLAGFALYFALARQHGGWRRLEPLAGALILAGLCLPWYGVEAAIHGSAFLARAPWFPYASGSHGSPLAAAPLALTFAVVSSFPWTPLLAAALADAALRLRRATGHPASAGRPAPGAPLDAEHVEHLLLTLALTASATVALYPSPPLTAALPVLPAVALLVGRFADRALEGAAENRALAHAARWLALLGTAFALAAALLSVRLAEAAAPVRLFAVVVFLASWAPLLADLRGARRLAVGLFALPAAAGAPLLHARVLPALEPWLNAHAVVEAFARWAPPGAPLVVWEPPPPSLRQGVRANLVRASQLGPGGAPAVARDGYVYAAWRPAREGVALAEIAGRSADGPRAEVLARTPVLVLARFRPRD